jgi:hypothetical protein
MQAILRRLLDRLDAIADQHAEVGDTAVREAISEAVFDGFLRPICAFALPDRYAMFSEEGDLLVKRALAEFLPAAILLTKPLKSLVEHTLLRPLKTPPAQLSNLIFVSLAALLATSPIVAATFGQVANVGVFTNLIAVPLSGPILILGSRRKHLPLASLPTQSLQRLSGHDPDTDRAGSRFASVRVGNDTRRNPAPRRPVLRRMRPPVVAGRAFSSERRSLWAALLLIWSALWIVLVAGQI